MRTSQEMSTGKNAILEESPLSQVQSSWLEKQRRGQVSTQEQEKRKQQRVQVRQFEGLSWQVAHSVAQLLQVWSTMIGLVAGQEAMQLPECLQYEEAQVLQVAEEEQLMQLVGQTTQLPLIWVQPEDGQASTQEVLRSRQLASQVEQEKAPLRQVAQGLTQVVHKSWQGYVGLGHSEQQVCEQMQRVEGQLVQLLAVLLQVWQAVALQAWQVVTTEQVPAGQVSTQVLLLQRKQLVTQLTQSKAELQYLQGEMQNTQFPLPSLYLPSGHASTQVLLQRRQLVWQVEQKVREPEQVAQGVVHIKQTLLRDRQPVGQAARQVLSELREQLGTQLRQQVALVQFRHWFTQGTQRELSPYQVLGQASTQLLLLRKAGLEQAVQAVAVPEQLRQAELSHWEQVVEAEGRQQPAGQAARQEELVVRRQLREVQGEGRQEVQRLGEMTQALQGTVQQGEMVRALLAATKLLSQVRVEMRAAEVVKQAAVAEKVRLRVVLKETRLLTVYTCPDRLQTAPDNDAVQLVVGVRSEGRDRVNSRREGLLAVTVKGVVNRMLRVDEESRISVFVGMQEAARVAGVIVAEAVPCSVRKVLAVSLVVSCREKALVPAYQLLVRGEMVVVRAELGVPVMVILRVEVVCWRQERVRPGVVVVQVKPALRVVEAGRVRRRLSPEQWGRLKVREMRQLVRALAVGSLGVIEANDRLAGVVMVTPIPEQMYSISRLLQQVSTWTDPVGLVDPGLVIPVRVILIELSAARELGTHPVILNCMLAMEVMEHENVTSLAVNVDNAAEAAVGKSVGKVRMRWLVAGRGLRVVRVKEQEVVAATVVEEGVTEAAVRVVAVAVRVRPAVRVSTGVEALMQQVLMLKEEVGVVVTGLLTPVTVIGTLVPPETAIAVILTQTAVELSCEQVELREQVQVLDEDRLTSVGRVATIVLPEMRALDVVKARERVVEVAPMVELESVAEAVAEARVEVMDVRVRVLESTGQQMPPTRFWLRKVTELERLAQGALVTVNEAIKREVTWLVELVRLPISSVFAVSVGTVAWVVCWLEATYEQPILMSPAQATERKVMEETGLARLRKSEMVLVPEMVLLVGAKLTEMKVPATVGAKVGVQVMQEGLEVEDRQQRRLTVTEMGRVEAGLRALSMVTVPMLEEAALQRDEQVSIQLKKPCPVLGLRMAHRLLQTEAAVPEGKLVRVYALQAGNCTCRMEPAAMVTEGVQVREQLVVAPTVEEMEVRVQTIGALVMVRRAELLLQVLAVLPGWQQVRVVTNEPAQ